MNKEKWQQLAHTLAGIVTLIYGFDTFEAGDFKSASSYLSLAILFMIVAGVHKWITTQFMQADVAFFYLKRLQLFIPRGIIKPGATSFYIIQLALQELCILFFQSSVLNAKKSQDDDIQKEEKEEAVHLLQNTLKPEKITQQNNCEYCLKNFYKEGFFWLPAVETCSTSVASHIASSVTFMNFFAAIKSDCSIFLLLLSALQLNELRRNDDAMIKL